MAKKSKSYGKMNLLDKIAGWLLIIGGLVHGGQAFDFYFVDKLGEWLNFIAITKFTYIAVGASAVYFVYRMFRRFK